MIILIIILSFLILFHLWIFFSPIVLEIDSRVPHAGIRWASIGEAWLWYDESWWLSFRILFFRKKIKLPVIKKDHKKISKQTKKVTVRKKNYVTFKKIIRVIKTFKVKQWEIGIDTGDNVLNAQLYPLNHLPYSFGHLNINFKEENFIYIKVYDNAWRILYAFLR